MAAIDDKFSALNFQITTGLSPDRVGQILGDAAEIAATFGPKVTLTQIAPHQIEGIVRNFARVQMAQFVVTFNPIPQGGTGVNMLIGDYLRTRETLFYFIPVSPWGAPGYKTVAKFVEHVRNSL